MVSPTNIALLVGLFIPLMTSGTFPTEVPSERRVWCYYTNWAQYRPGTNKYTVDDVNPKLCTHFSYAFATVKNNLVVPFEYNDDSSSIHIGMYHKFNQLRSLNPQLKTFLAVGGWNFGSVPFSEIARSLEMRHTFIDSVIKFLRQRNFDGLDLDWEYPANRGGNKDDKKYFSLLIKGLYEAFEEDAIRRNRPRLMLAIAVGAAKHVVDSAYDVPEISRFVDFFNVMTYDFHGSWENKTAHSSPLFPRRDEKGTSRYWNTAWAAIYWIQKGAPLDKINIGIPLYGRSFTLSDPKENGIGANAPKPGERGKVTQVKGVLSYFEACQMLKSGAKRVFIKEQEVPYLVQKDQWVGYEDRESVVAKVEWLLRNKFTGIMVWAMDMDDYRGICGNGKYPLMKAINQVLYEQKPVTEPEVLQRTVSVKPETNVNIKEEFCKYRPFGVYPSGVSCQHFVLCLGGYDFLNKCPSNMNWDSSSKICVSHGNSECAKTEM